MALELTSGISATATVLTVTGTLPTDLAYGYEFRIGDELLTFERYEPDRTLMAGQSAEVPFAPIPSLFVWQVRRGQGGSTAASHLAAASLVGVNEANVSGVTTAKPIPWPSGGGGGAVDSVNTQTGVVVLDAGDIATAVAPGPTVEDTLAALAGASSPLVVFTKTLSAADIISLSGGGPNIVVLPADAAKRYVVSTVTWTFHAGNTGFTFSDAPVQFALCYDGSSGMTQFPFYAFSDAFATSEQTFGPDPIAGALQLSFIDGVALTVVQATALTISDGDGTLDVTITYRVVTLP